MKQFVKEILLFVLVLGLVISLTFHFAYPSYVDGIYDMTIYYQQEENTVDVLVLGSSHAFEAVNTAVLWKEAGIASFILAGSMQPMWNSYYYLKEALKYQTPKLIVLEVYSVVMKEDYSDNSKIIKNTFGLKNSEDRTAAIRISSPEEQYQDYLLGFPAYHAMVLDVTAGDLLPYKGNPDYYKNWKGFLENYKTIAFAEPDVSGVYEAGSMTDKTYEYFIKTIELAQENNIPLLLIAAPYYVEDDDQEIFNQVSNIAKEYGVNFVNYNLCIDQIGLDYSTDLADCHHLNYLGNMKFTTVLADYITENYELTDRRGDDRWQTWEKSYQYWLDYRQKKTAQLTS